MQRVCFLHLANRPTFLIVLSSVMPSLTLPIHSVVIIGDKVEMNCGVTGSNLTTLWNYTSWNTSTERVIYRGGDIVDSLRSRYKIDKNISGQHNLIIDSVDFAHAGRYICTSGIDALWTYIRLIVLASHPICAANISATQNDGGEQNHLSIWCSISYAGPWWNPVFSWTKGSEENIAANRTFDSSRGLRTTTSLIIQQLHATDRGVEFQCQITFVNPFIYEIVYSYMYMWNYTLPHGPLNLRIVEYGGGLECSADGDPAPTYRWTRVDTKSSIEGPMILLDGNGQTFQCTATNVFGSERKNFTITKCSNKFCDNETDTKYSIHWNRTIAGTNSSEPCPWNPTGWCSRECLPNTIWSQPTCNSCADKKFNDFFVRVNTLNLTALDNQNVTAKIASDLSTATNNSEGLTPGNLKASVELIKLLSDAIQRNDSNATINEMEIKSIVKAASNVLRPNNSESWETLKKENQNIATSILLSLDNYGRSLAALNISENRKEEENLILEAWSFEKSNLREIEFPSRSLWDEDRGDGISISVEALQSSMLSVRPTLKMWGSYYRTVNEYLPGHKDTDVVNSRVLSFSIDGLKTNEELKRPVIITLRHNQENRTGFQRKCAFWNFGSGTWDFDGCSVTLTNRTHTICSCNHLTNFAILMSLTPKEEDKLLNLISVIGCSISAAALILTILIYALTWKQSKSAQATVLLNLCVALASAYLIFLAGADKFEEEKYQKDGCTAVAVLLHYFFLAAFFIMLIEGVELVLYIIFVFHVRRTRETIMLIVSAWVLPLIIVGVSLGSTRFDGYGHKNACWLSAEKGLIWAFIGPVLFIVTANFVILIVVLSWMSQKKALLAKNGKKRDEIRATIWNLSVTCPVLGLGWLFGVLSLISDHVGFQYLFVIVNSLQGLLIFIFHALFHNKKMNEKISSFYSNYICRCRKSKLSVSTQITSAQEQSTSTTAASKATTEMTSAQEQSTSSILALTSTTEISPAQEQSTSSTPALTTTTEMTLAQDQATSSTSVTKVSTEMSSAQEQSTSSTRASASTAEVTSSQEQSTSSTSTSKVTTEMSSDQEQSTSSTSAKDSSAANKKPTDKAKVVPRAVKYYEDLIGRAGQFAQRCSAAYDQWRL